MGDAVKNGILPEYEIVGVLGRNPERTKAAADYYECTACTNIDQLMNLKPEFVSEAASAQALKFIARTPFYREGLMDITKPERVFTGTAKKIMESFPYVFNVILAMSLASAWPEDIKFNIDATPNFLGDDYRIQVGGDEVQLDLSILSQDYSIAGWSVVTILKMQHHLLHFNIFQLIFKK